MACFITGYVAPNTIDTLMITDSRVVEIHVSSTTRTQGGAIQAATQMTSVTFTRVGFTMGVLRFFAQNFYYSIQFVRMGVLRLTVNSYIANLTLL
jgi:hypothetical protein